MTENLKRTFKISRNKGKINKQGVYMWLPNKFKKNGGNANMKKMKKNYHNSKRNCMTNILAK